MNKRILKLAQQTDAWCDQNHVDNESYDILWEERFAELLIDECCKALDNTERHRRDYFIAKIREHFEMK